PSWPDSPRTVRRARSSSSWTVRLPGWDAQPAKPVPSYSIVSLVTMPARPARGSDELDEHHLGRVAAAWTELEDARVAAGAPGVARCHLLEQLVHGELVLRERRERLPASVQIAALGQRDQLLDLRLDGLGLRLGRLDPLVLDDLLAQVHQQRLAVRGVPAELVSCLLMTHGVGSVEGQGGQ